MHGVAGAHGEYIMTLLLLRLLMQKSGLCGGCVFRRCVGTVR